MKKSDWVCLGISIALAIPIALCTIHIHNLDDGASLDYQAAPVQAPTITVTGKEFNNLPLPDPLPVTVAGKSSLQVLHADKEPVPTCFLARGGTLKTRYASFTVQRRMDLAGNDWIVRNCRVSPPNTNLTFSTHGVYVIFFLPSRKVSGGDQAPFAKYIVAVI